MPDKSDSKVVFKNFGFCGFSGSHGSLEMLELTVFERGWFSKCHCVVPVVSIVLMVSEKHRAREPCKSVCPLQGSKAPKSGKEGFGVKKPPFPPHPRKRSSRVKKSPFSLYRCTCIENGDFLTRDALFWGGGKWGFFDSETLFSRFWGF